MVEYQCFPRMNAHPERGLYLGYGLRAVRGGQTLAQISDIATQPQELERLAAQCNRLALDPVHLADVVEDYLAGL